MWVFYWWVCEGVIIGGIDIGVFVLVDVGLLRDWKVMVYYEYIDVFIEMVLDMIVCEDFFVIDGRLFMCCGGMVVFDVVFYFLKEYFGVGIVNVVVRYVFYYDICGLG